ncbi:MAG: hypothetical protein MZV63_50325 [Marinilabiliales bacterium]|nr:hypothetical protein [Marinilabiliales bacterium]
MARLVADEALRRRLAERGHPQLTTIYLGKRRHTDVEQHHQGNTNTDPDAQALSSSTA